MGLRARALFAQLFSGFSSKSPPAIPTFISVTWNVASELSGSLDLDWTDNSTNATGIEIWKSTDNVTYSLHETATPGAGQTPWGIVGLTNDQLYYLKIRAVGAGGASSFTGALTGTPRLNPVDVSTVAMYYDAYRDRGTYADNDPAGTLNDYGPNAWHLTSAATARPLFKTNVVNTSYPVFRFDGVNDWASVAAIDLLGASTDFVIFLVLKAGTTQNGFADIMDAGHGNQGPFVIQMNGAVTNQYYCAIHDTTSFGSSLLALTDVGTSAFQILEIYKSGTSLKHLINGVETASATINATVRNLVNDFALCALYDGSARFWKGDIATMFIGIDVSAGQRVNLRNRLNAQFALY